MDNSGVEPGPHIEAHLRSGGMPGSERAAVAVLKELKRDLGGHIRDDRERRLD